MKTVTGPTDHVVVIGAGLGGLSAALRLAGAGRQVTVLERQDIPGGRAGRIVDSGYTFDTGPTVLTMPELVGDALAAVGEEMSDWLDLRPLDPIYRTYYPDGSQLDVHADPQRMAAEIRRVVGPGEAAGYLRYVDHLRALYDVEFADFIDRNTDHPWDLLTPRFLQLVRLGGFRRLDTKVRQFLQDPRTIRSLSFQAMYAGVSPFSALALYGVISYMDSVAGVSVPRGGMHEIPKAMADAAAKHGVNLRYDTEVAHIETRGSRATAVVTTDGERIAADVVVVNADLPVAYRDLLGREPWSVRRLRYSPSAFVMLVGSDRHYPGAAHHNIHFGGAWRRTFEELISRQQLMSDPSLMVTNLSHDDPSLAPPGRHAYYVLFPTPNATADIDWDRETPRYTDQILQVLEDRGYRGFGSGIEVQHITTPKQWEERGMAAGAPFAAAHTLLQTGPFRPGNLWGDNVVFTGSGTRPGVGVPMVLVSGRLAAERVTGRTA
ncbi:MAG: phytoene desaturase family protein [Candidatus Nanopelagicales bacterium]